MEKEKIIQRIEELIEIGNKLIEPNDVYQIQRDIYDKWTVNIENLIRFIYPNRLNEIHDEFRIKSRQVNRLGIAQYKVSFLEATKEDLEKGLIRNLEYEIRRIEINSLLDYSFKLLDENDDVLDRCACVLSRIVLEKALQLLCEKEGFDSTKKASELNQDLWKNNVYPQAQWRHIGSLLDVGNAAAHSGDEWGKIGKEQRRRAVRDIDEFTKKKLRNYSAYIG